MRRTSGHRVCRPYSAHDPARIASIGEARYEIGPGVTPLAPCRDGLPPIAGEPLPLCPNCEYNLTSLTTRRCPECGDCFTIRDAIRAGHGETPRPAWADRAAWWVERIEAAAGLLLVVGGLGRGFRRRFRRRIAVRVVLFPAAAGVVFLSVKDRSRPAVVAGGPLLRDSRNGNRRRSGCEL